MDKPNTDPSNDPISTLAKVTLGINDRLEAVHDRVDEQGKLIDQHAEVINSNADLDVYRRQVEAGKELMRAYLKESQLYVTGVIAAGYLGFFTLFSAMLEKLNEREIRWSILLMLLSLGVYVIWTVATLTHTAWLAMKGDGTPLQELPKWTRDGWLPVLVFCLATALVAVGFAVNRLLLGLGFQIYP